MSFYVNPDPTNTPLGYVVGVVPGVKIKTWGCAPREAPYVIEDGGGAMQGALPAPRFIFH